MTHSILVILCSPWHYSWDQNSYFEFYYYFVTRTLAVRNSLLRAKTELNSTPCSKNRSKSVTTPDAHMESSGVTPYFVVLFLKKFFFFLCAEAKRVFLILEPIENLYWIHSFEILSRISKETIPIISYIHYIFKRPRTF